MPLPRARTAVLAAALALLAAPATAAPPFALRDGDRVVLLGDTLIEREQYHGYIELALTTRFPERHVTFRNIGWSADTPAGDSRLGLSLLQAGLEPPGEGWRQLQEQIKQLKPTVVILGYGMASSFAGEAGLPQFVADYNRLLDMIPQLAGGPVRFLLLGPAPLLRPHRLSFAVDRRPGVVQEVGRYGAAIAEIGQKRQIPFVSFAARLTIADLQAADTPKFFSDNGIHLNAAGYRAAAEALEQELGWEPGGWRAQPQAARLREIILKKNELFFHRSRPANMAYIFGFRRREQGKNAVEIPQFDPLIEAEEKNIALLRSLKPVELPPEPPPRTQSAAAKFTPQPHPAFDVADGLEVSLWAENPKLHKPIQMNWDARGQLWVASSEVYPQVEPGQTADDKIIVLEDTDGDGKADKSTVFADGLLIPTGLEPGDGGVYVAQSTELLHLKDTNGDGKADERRIVLSGFGTEDTHHNLHTLRWGPDGRLWMNQSVYTRTDTETPHGVVRHRSGGVMRFDPRRQRLEFRYNGWWNPWGHAFDAFGQSFVTDGAGGDGISWGVPGAMYPAYAKARRLIGSISPGTYPKFSGLEAVYSKHFPDDWQGDFVTCDYRANRVVRFKVEEDGAGYLAREAGDLLRGKDVTFRPIDVKLGPDGALYVADWSNPIINHGEVDFRDPRRDRWHGRIWRIAAKGRPLAAKRSLVDAPNGALFDALLSPNGFERDQARRVLIERGPGVKADLEAWSGRHPDNDLAQLHAAWILNVVGVVDRVPTQRRLLRAKDARIRAAAARAMRDWGEEYWRSWEGLYELHSDPHPRVRLEALRSASVVNWGFARFFVERVLSQPIDRFLDYALWLTFNDLADPWLAALASGEFPVKGNERAIEIGLKAVDPEKAGQALAALLAKHPLTRDGQGPWVELIGQAGGPAELRQLFEQAVQGGFDTPTTARALRALGQAARLRRARPAGDLKPLLSFLEAPDEALRAAAISLAGRWRLNEAAARILALAADRAASAALRTAAFDALRDLRSPEATAKLRTIAQDAADALPARRQAALALFALDAGAGLPTVKALLAEAGDRPDAAEFWRAVLGQQGAAPRLAAALRAEPIPEAAAAAGLRVAREGAGRGGDLERVLARIAGAAAPRTYTPGEVQRASTLAALRGDPVRGELVYRRSELRCVACHSIGGAGGKVGPDLGSLGAAAPLDYIVESVLLPEKAVKEGFHSVTIATLAGRTHTGLLVRETAREVVLRDANSQEIAVPKNAIDERATGGSLMPAGLIDPLFEGERDDLFRFLAELGKPGPFDVAKSPHARLWHLVAAAPADEPRAQRGDPELAGWLPLTTTVGGALLKNEVGTLLPTAARADKVVYAVTRFDSPKGGPARFEFSAAPAAVWLDGKVVAADRIVTADLARGTHTLVIRLDPTAMADRVVVKSGDVVFQGN